jgi:hypothetical protein
MKTKLIKLQDKFMLVNDEEIKEGDTYVYLNDGFTGLCKSQDHADKLNFTKRNRVVFSENPDFSLLSEADCKAIGWVDVEKLAENYNNTFQARFGDKPPYIQNAHIMNHWKEGFKAHQELVKDKMFSLEDINAIREMLVQGALTNMSCSSAVVELDKIIQSLQQTSWDVEVEMEDVLSSKEIKYAEEGDFVMNKHNSGIINYLSNDIRVGIGNYIEMSQTGSNGHDTLEICGYKIYDIRPKITNNSIRIVKILPRSWE